MDLTLTVELALHARPALGADHLRRYLRGLDPAALAGIGDDAKVLAEVRKVMPGALATELPVLADLPTEIHKPQLMEWFLDGGCSATRGSAARGAFEHAPSTSRCTMTAVDFSTHRCRLFRYYPCVRLAWLALVVACGHVRAMPVPQEASPPKEPMQSPGVAAVETHAPKPIDAQAMPPLYPVGDDLRFSILMPPQEEPITQEWTGYFLADGKKLPNTDFKVVKVKNGRGATGSIAANRLSAPNKLPSSDVRLFSPRVEH